MESIFLNTIVGLLTLGSVVGGWFLRQLWDAVQTLRKDMGALEVKLAEEYIPYNRLQDAMRPIMEALTEIKETLKTKADK